MRPNPRNHRYVLNRVTFWAHATICAWKFSLLFEAVLKLLMKFPRAFLSGLIVLGLLAVIAATGVLWLSRTHSQWTLPLGISRTIVFNAPILNQRPTRPYGMAPVAWNAYLRACRQAKIHPLRVGQTIGNHPRSVGYHKRDGVLRVGKERVDYSAAVDLGTWDLTPAQINSFVDALADQGFAAFYRHKGKWKGGEHIHAIYAFLPMKPQLQLQVKEFLQSRKREGKSPKWRAKLKQQESKLKHWMVW